MRIKIALQRSDNGDIDWLQKGSVNHPYSSLSADEVQTLKLGSIDFENLAKTTPDKTLESKSALTGKKFSIKSIFKKSPESSIRNPETFPQTRDLLDIDSEVSKKLHVSKGDPLLFLFNGFRELLCCRSLLQGSFVYGFYFFERRDMLDDEDSVWYGHMEQSLLMSRKQSYEQLQSDLESLVEMLSDVVARKRLRASKAQIDQATAAARSKRIEFEYFIMSTERSLTEANIYSESNRGLRSKIPTSRKSGNRHDRRLSSQSVRSQSRFEDPNSSAIMDLLSDMRRTHTPDQVQALAQLQAAEERVRRIREQRNPFTSQSSVENLDSSRKNGVSFLDRLDSASSPPSSSKFVMRGKHFSTPPSSEADERTPDAQIYEATPDDRTVGDTDEGYLNHEMLQIQSEEEELNRAILLSMSQMSIASISLQNTEIQTEPSLSNISVLVSMGFSVDQSRIALAHHNDNLEFALNELIVTSSSM